MNNKRKMKKKVEKIKINKKIKIKGFRNVVVHSHYTQSLFPQCTSIAAILQTTNWPSQIQGSVVQPGEIPFSFFSSPFPHLL
jgi:hypothetical protein